MDMGNEAVPIRALLVSDADDASMGADLAAAPADRSVVLVPARDWADAQMRAGDFDVVLITAGSDVADALGFLERARREDTLGPKFVFASTNAESSVEGAAREAGASEILTGADATPAAILRVVRHAGELRRMEGRLTEIALFDSLTGLPSQVLFWQFLDHAAHRAARTEEHFAVMSIYIEGLAAINTHGGWEMGNRAIVRVAQRLRDTLRAADTVSRFAGPKFTVLLESVREDTDAQLVAYRLIDVLAAPIELDGKSFALGATVGIALHPTSADTPQALLEKSLSAMDHAKDGGPGTIHFA